MARPYTSHYQRRNARRGRRYQRRPQQQLGFPPNFLSQTPGYESDIRGLNDQLTGGLADIANQRARVPENLEFQLARLGTNQGYATQQLNENLVDRGIYDSGIRPFLTTRDISIPYGRQRQDLANEAAQTLAQLAQQEAGLYLGYNQGNAEALLGRAADASQQLPLGQPQYGRQAARRGRRRRRGRNNGRNR